MAKSSGTTRSSSSKTSAPTGYRYERETEKAVLIKLRLYAEYAPEGGFVSSMVRDRNIDTNVWIPKSQFENGQPTNWILQQKANEIAERYTPMNGRVLSTSAKFYDADNKEVKGVISAREKEWAKEREAVHAERVAKGVEKAKETRIANAGRISSTKIVSGASISSPKYGSGTISRVITKSTGYVEVKYSNGSIRKEMAFNLNGEDGKPLKITKKK